jgi:hypothetical protein
MRGKLQCISLAVALFTVMTACDKDKAADPPANPLPPPPPPPVSLTHCDNWNRAKISAQLIPIGKLSQGRGGLAVVAVGSKILFAGGDFMEGSGFGSSRVEIYDIVTNTWSITELSSARGNIATVVAGNKVFFGGGSLEGWDNGYYKAFDTVDIYNAADNTWTVARLSEARGSLAAAAVGDKVFFAGGINDMNTAYAAAIDIYNLSTGTWYTTLLSEARSLLSAVTLNNKIYFAGGFQQAGGGLAKASNRIDIYDYTTNTWSVDTLKRPMAFPAGIVAADQIYWAENCNVEIKNVLTGNSTEAFLFKPGYPVSAVVKDNKIVFFRDYSEGQVTTFDIYDISTNTWFIGIVPIKLVGASIVSVNNTIYLAGGWVDGAFNDQVWKLEF